ncbi:MAG TPA: glycoside hydrolase family 16 protein [Kiritimatiellia bacterium]
MGTWAALVLASTAVCQAQLYSNVLVNPGFESGTADTNVTGWYRFNNCYRYADPVAHSGTYAMAAWGNWYPPASWNASGLYQQYPASEGQVWEASVWGRVNGSVTGAAFGTLIIELYNAQTNNIFSRTCARRIDAATPTGTWFQITGKVRATRNTAFIRVIPAFLQSPAFEGGAVWLDDAALYQVETNRIEFAGRTWEVSDWISTPGENFFSKESVFTDSNGWLHLRCTQVSGTWCSAALETLAPLGFGEYRWHLGSRIDLLDSNLVVGLFTYAQEGVFNTNQNEVDIEFSRAFPGTQTNWLVYTIQPYTIPGMSDAQTAVLTNELTTHRFIWRPDEVHWQSYYGHTAEPEPGSVFGEWRNRGRGIPIETNERCIMNFWLFYTNAPRDTQYLEFVVRDFEFIPFDGFIFTDDFADGVMSTAWEVVGSGIVKETNGILIVWPPADATSAGYATTNTIHRNERGTKYVFSALLEGLGVVASRIGPDVRTIMSFSRGTNSAWEAASAAQLQADYDVEANNLTLSFFAKTNAPVSDGSLFFRGVISNVVDWLVTGGIDLRMELEPSNYAVRAKSASGAAIAIAATVGSPSGTIVLAESLTNGFWFVGGQNGGTDSTGIVVWSRASVGIGDQAEQPQLDASVVGSVLHLSAPSFFGERYSIYKGGTITGDFVSVVTGIEASVGGLAVTDAMSGAAGFYRLQRD